MRLSLLALCATLFACSGRRAVAPHEVTLTTAEGARQELARLAAAAPFTVVVFVSAECPCLHAHLARLRTLAAEYGPKGVQFVGVDSEVGGSAKRAKTIAHDLELPFPVLVDDGAHLAEAWGAEYATFTVIVDRSLTVRYRGGIDSDKRKMHDQATPYVREALDDLLAGRAPRRTEGKALGCVLRKW